ncbi:MAG: YdeI/OmpD-associated family protein [Dinghuibacter sp.]|nr:YdeI/OmpD-associated family protein [Dinghuibacter sp.]
MLQQHKDALTFFESLSFTNKKEYVLWITGARKEDTRDKRLTMAIEKLRAGRKNPSEK